MIKTGLLAFGVAFALISAPVAFADAPAATPTQTASTDADKDKVVCKKEESTGSRLNAHKICKTKAEWAQDAEATKTLMRSIDIHGGAAPSVPGGG